MWNSSQEMEIGGSCSLYISFIKNRSKNPEYAYKILKQLKKGKIMHKKAMLNIQINIASQLQTKLPGVFQITKKRERKFDNK